MVPKATRERKKQFFSIAEPEHEREGFEHNTGSNTIQEFTGKTLELYEGELTRGRVERGETFRE